MDCIMPALPVHHQLPEPTQTQVHGVCDAIQPFPPVSSLFLPPSIFPSIRGFSNESVLKGVQSIGVSASASVFPINIQDWFPLGLTDWLDLLAVQGHFKSLLQHHSSKASTLQLSAFSTVHLSHPYMTTGKNIALTRQTFVGKIMSLPFFPLQFLTTDFISQHIPKMGGKRRVIFAVFFHHWSPVLLSTVVFQSFD